jgi:tetratricopeptide (TPR) repeat protein
MQMAMTYEIDGNFTSAMDEYARYLNKYPDRFREVERRIDLAGRTDAELVELRKSINLLFQRDVFSKDRIYQLLSRINIRLADNGAAFKNLCDAENANKQVKTGTLVYPFAVSIFRMGDFATAITAGKYLIASGENYAEKGRQIVAESSEALGKYDEALTEFEQLRQSRATDMRTVGILGIARIQIQKGLYESARRTLDPLLHPERPTLDVVKLVYQSFFMENNMEQASKALEGYSNLFGDDPWYLFALGEAKLFLGNYEDASKIFETAVSRSSESPTANDAIEYLLLLSLKDEPRFGAFIEARKDWRLGKRDDAIKTLGDLRDNSGRLTVNAMWDLGRFLVEMSRPTEATPVLESLVEKFPDDFYTPFALEQLGDIALESGDTATAFERYNKALHDFPNSIITDRVRIKARKVSQS